MKSWLERIDNVEKLKKRWKFEKISYIICTPLCIIVGIGLFIANFSTQLNTFALILLAGGAVVFPIFYPIERKAYEKRLQELQENQNNNNKFS